MDGGGWNGKIKGGKEGKKRLRKGLWGKRAKIKGHLISGNLIQ